METQRATEGVARATVRATEAQPGSLKALADAVLARNRARNDSATESEKARNLRTAETNSELRPFEADCAAPESLPDPAARPGAATQADPDLFTFTPPGDPANDDEALQERVAIMMDGNGWDDATALREAHWQADRERCWRLFIRNAGHILAAPAAKRGTMLARYREEAIRRYGEATGRDMAGSLRSWIEARRVH